MSNELEELTAIVEKCFADVRQASVMFDIAWLANEQGHVPQALNGYLAGHTYQRIFFSLIESSALALLRFLDNQNGAAHLDSFLTAVEQRDVRQAVLAEIRSWPATGDNKEAHQELCCTIQNIASAQGRILPFLPKLRRYRNSSLAHAQIKLKGDLPTFDDLRRVINECECIAEHMKRIVTGTVADITDYRDIYKQSAEEFWRALIDGLPARTRQ